MLLTDRLPGPLEKLLSSLVAILLSVHPAIGQESESRLLTGTVVSEDTGLPLFNVLVELEAQGLQALTSCAALRRLATAGPPSS